MRGNVLSVWMSLQAISKTNRFLFPLYCALQLCFRHEMSHSQHSLPSLQIDFILLKAALRLFILHSETVEDDVVTVKAAQSAICV